MLPFDRHDQRTRRRDGNGAGRSRVDDGIHEPSPRPRAVEIEATSLVNGPRTG